MEIKKCKEGFKIFEIFFSHFNIANHFLLFLIRILYLNLVVSIIFLIEFVLNISFRHHSAYKNDNQSNNRNSFFIFQKKLNLTLSL